ncbi:MAG: DUF86 domain-containing protein [Deltaproteobacteria bacterium]|nr:DUF86 domain-containing protein [Deltaproteobacteria bacterium]
MVDSHLVEQRLASIRDRLARIDATLPPDRRAFLADRTIQEVVAFNLFLAFQEALDLAAHLIADAGWELPTTAREHFEVLERHAVLSPHVARSMAGCAGLRNLIAHTYGSVDLARLHDELPLGRDALLAFSAEIAAASGPTR